MQATQVQSSLLLIDLTQVILAMERVIKTGLSLQLTSPVQWQLTLETLIGKGLERSIEIGPNKVIAGIMKRISKDHEISNVFA